MDAIGCRPPDFELKDLGGKTYKLHDCFPNKNVILWMTNLCSGCQKRLPALERLYKTYSKDFEIFAISVLGSDIETPSKIQEHYNPSFPLLVDPEDWVGQKLGFLHPNDACPMYNLLIIGRSGKVVARNHLSRIKESELEKTIVSLKEKP